MSALRSRRLVSGERYDVAVLTCASGLGEHSDQCVGFSESQARDAVCIDAVAPKQRAETLSVG